MLYISEMWNIPAYQVDDAWFRARLQ